MMQGGVEIMKKVTSENLFPLIYGLSILYLFIAFFLLFPLFSCKRVQGYSLFREKIK